MQKSGMFWIVDGKLITSPYNADEAEKLGRNSYPYTQKTIWERVRPDRNFRKNDYYPRGRVEYDSNGKPMIVLGKSVKESFIPLIQEAFEISDKPHIIRDHLKHYDSEEDRANDREARRKRAKRFRRIDTI